MQYGELNPGEYQNHLQGIGQNIRFMESFVNSRLRWGKTLAHLAIANIHLQIHIKICSVHETKKG